MEDTHQQRPGCAGFSNYILKCTKLIKFRTGLIHSFVNIANLAIHGTGQIVGSLNQVGYLRFRTQNSNSFTLPFSGHLVPANNHN
nr:MAG TPA: hypothetical protein [Caudoviricetes sp.]